jgi:hypothetical protein
MEKEAVRVRAKEWESVGMEYYTFYSGERGKNEGGRVWRPRFEGDQWTRRD